MLNHKFKIGQIVEYLPGKLQASAPRGSYKIMRLLPAEGNGHQYRIKNTAEPFERIALESQLTSKPLS